MNVFGYLSYVLVHVRRIGERYGGGVRTRGSRIKTSTSLKPRTSTMARVGLEKHLGLHFQDSPNVRTGLRLRLIAGFGQYVA